MASRLFPLASLPTTPKCATAGGCLASHYLAAWVIARLAGWSAAESVVHYVAPVGQKQEYVERAHAVVQQYLPGHERVANLAG